MGHFSFKTIGSGAVALAALLGVTVLHPYDRLTWLLEVLPVLVVVPLILAAHPRFPLTKLLAILVFVHCVILIVGGHYTYARVPLGFWMQETFALGRNPYDKIGHFAQGFVPAIAAREILLRGRHVAGGKMLFFIVCSIVLAISASYELVEWMAALALGQGADEFLGTQGDPWDTQSDMGFALIGALTALLCLWRWHDRQLAKLAGSSQT